MSWAVALLLSIVGGSPAAACEWPAAVAIVGDVFCTGVLVHPRVVLYAAHCGQPDEIVLGEDLAAPAAAVAPQRCVTNPLFDGEVGSSDFALCLLEAPLDDVPTAPPLAACERQQLGVGSTVVVVGFGDVDGDDAGRKHAVETTVVDRPAEGIVLIGGGGEGACAGDSGGPTFVQLDDGSWRVAALTSGVPGGACGEAAAHILLDRVIPWAEDDTGIDLTPCTDREDSWSPTPACRAAPTTAGAGTWDSGCDAGPTGPISTCGDPFDFAPDEIGPTVAIVSPTDGTRLPDWDSMLSVEVDASDVGWGVEAVVLEVDGDPWLDASGAAARDGVAPFAFHGVELEVGDHTLVAVATDFAGNSSRSDAVDVLVEGDEGGTEGDGGDEPADPTEAGCGCRGAHGSALPLLVLLWARRPIRTTLVG